MSAPIWCRAWSRPASTSSTSAAASAQPYQPHGAWKSVETVTLDRDAEEKAGTFGGKIRELEAGHRHRHDLLHARQRASSWSRRCAGRCSTSCTAARSGCMARASRCRPPRCSRAGPSASTASRRRRSRRTCSTRRGAAASRRRSSIPAISSGRAGRRSTRPATSTRRSSRSWRAGEELALPNFGPGDGAPRPCRRCGAGVHAGDRQLERRGRRGLPRRFAGGPHAARLCRGDGRLVRPARRGSTSCRGRNGRRARRGERPTATWEHIAHSPNCSIAKAERLLGYRPRYTSFEAVYESVALADQGGHRQDGVSAARRAP